VRIKYKWMTPFIMWPPFIAQIAFEQAAGWPSDRATRVIYVIGVLVITGVLLALIQPWQPDKPRGERG
jgi:hypothetical protein